MGILAEATPTRAATRIAEERISKKIGYQKGSKQMKAIDTNKDVNECTWSVRMGKQAIARELWKDKVIK